METKAKRNCGKTLSEKCQLSRFSDYFVICGLDLENGLEADLYSGLKILMKFSKRLHVLINL